VWLDQASGIRNCLGGPSLDDMTGALTLLAGLLRRSGRQQPARTTPWEQIAAEDMYRPEMDGQARFEIWLNLIQQTIISSEIANQSDGGGDQAIVNKEKTVKVPVFSSKSGKIIGDVRRSGGRVSISADPRETEFARWLEANGTKVLERLHREWSDRSESDD
jgi:hypothetical protein